MDRRRISELLVIPDVDETPADEAGTPDTARPLT